MTIPRDTELVRMRKQAEAWAASRRESVTSAHLLAAVADTPGIAADLLRERGMTPEGLLKAARSSTDDERDPVRSAIQRAREVATHMRAPEPAALHLLVALLGARRCAGYRVLDQCGVDVSRLRVAAMNAGLERLGRRRIVTRRNERLAETPWSAEKLQPNGPRPSRAVTVPLTPKPVITRRAKPQDRTKPEDATPEPTDTNGSASGSSASGSVSNRGQDGGHSGAQSNEQQASTDASAGPLSSTPIRASRAKRKRSTKARFALDARRFKTLCALGRNLTQAAANDELEVVVGREAEVEQVLDVLAKREGNNPCLVGVAGVGKTSVVHAVAQHIASGAKLGLDERVLVEIPTAQLLAGTGVRGALAQRMSDIKKEVDASEGQVVLFFDEVHQLFGPDSSEELTGELKRALATGELPCIGATTPEEFQRCFESDATLLRRFSRLEVEEPGREQAQDILKSLCVRFSEHHEVQFTEQALELAVDWSTRYISGRALPDKAIAIIDLAGARARRRGLQQVGAEQVAEVVSETAQVPKERLLESDGARLLRLEQTLAERVVGHSDKLRSMARIIRRNAAGLGDSRPIGTFLLLGPTGVGKTETAKAIASALFGSEQAMTRLDLSEYSEAHAVARLVGAPPGYVGHEAGGQLTEAVRRRPYQVLLLDEIEKAHAEVLETFLPLLDEGRLTDGRGRTVDFSNTVIILTSNIGAREALGSTTRRLGFGQRNVREDSGAAQRVTAAAKDALSPEFFNRLDEVLVFEGLQRAEVEEIARRLLEKLANTIYDQREVELRIEPSVVEMLLDQGGFDAALGARPMKRAIARLVEAPLAEALLSQKLGSGDYAVLRARSAELEISVEPSPVVAAE